MCSCSLWIWSCPYHFSQVSVSCHFRCVSVWYHYYIHVSFQCHCSFVFVLFFCSCPDSLRYHSLRIGMGGVSVWAAYFYVYDSLQCQSTVFFTRLAVSVFLLLSHHFYRQLCINNSAPLCYDVFSDLRYCRLVSIPCYCSYAWFCSLWLQQMILFRVTSVMFLFQSIA